MSGLASRLHLGHELWDRRLLQLELLACRILVLVLCLKGIVGDLNRQVERALLIHLRLEELGQGHALSFDIFVVALDSFASARGFSRLRDCGQRAGFTAILSALGVLDGESRFRITDPYLTFSYP